MSEGLTRREMLAGTVPAATALGVGLLSLEALAQGGGTRTPARGAGIIEQMLGEAWADGQYRLPKLPYAVDALEPHIDAHTMQLHHDKHHLSYVDGLNKAAKNLAELHLAAEIDPARLYGLERDLSFNGGGHMLHTLFWATMAPGAGGAPQGPFADDIKQNFASFEAFKTTFSKVAAGIKGSGWALLSYEPIGDMLIITAVNEHDTHLVPGAVALLPLDVWEHAYYLKYQNMRADYIKAWWNVVNWPAVGEFYSRVRERAKGIIPGR